MAPVKLQRGTAAHVKSPAKSASSDLASASEVSPAFVTTPGARIPQPQAANVSVTMSNTATEAIRAGNRVLSAGNTGTDVQALQAWLNFKIRPPLLLDGTFGEKTQRALMEFQRSVGLPPSGVLDAPTLRALMPAAAVSPPVSETSMLTGSSLAAPVRPNPPGTEALDKTTDVLGLQGVVQDSVSEVYSARAVVSANGSTPKWLSFLTDVTLGKASALRAVGGPLGAVVRATATIMRLAPIISIPFAGYDVYKAAREPVPEKKPYAWANAAFTVGGTAAGTAAMFFMQRGLSPNGALASRSMKASAALFAVSAIVGAGQLVDAYVLDGKVQNAIGQKVKSLWTKMFG